MFTTNGHNCGDDRRTRDVSTAVRWRRTWLYALVVLLTRVSNARSVILTPPYFNLAEGRNITATATCGLDTEGPELYCKLVGANADTDINVSLIQGQTCDVCDPDDPKKLHLPRYAVDGRETWWQSPPLSRGMKYNEVNLTIDLGQEFHVAYVYIRMGNSPRPGLWVLEKSSDYGKTYVPWQYFSDSRSDCELYFGKVSLQPITKDDSVICSTEYSKIVPLEGGEIPISLLNNRPSASMYFNSTVLQEWTRATNVRLRLLRTKTLLGHLMSVARQDPTVTRRYFYSIKDISIGGRCMCNGHADTCDPDPRGSTVLLCRCQHNTCGPQCAECCPGFRQKAWRQSTGLQRFVCEPCNCFNHTNDCVYDADIDHKRLSLDIHGNYAGGGICQNCQHNTEGINCNTCKSTYYRPYSKRWNETDVCQPCECDYHFSTGNCAEGTGKCECRPEYTAPDCDSCSYGYFGYPDCRPCECNLNGTRGEHCESHGGQCPCKQNYAGKYCDECAEGYYNFPECLPCDCNEIGSLTSVCDRETGNCTCQKNFAGRTCDQCEVGFYNYPTCTYCRCDMRGTEPHVCDQTTGECVCREGFGGVRCDTCAPTYYGHPTCSPCSCSIAGSATSECDVHSGACACLSNFAGRTCDQCKPGYYQYPECLACNCDGHGSIGVSCDEEGKCHCQYNFDNMQCNQCKEGYYNYPNCEECNCHPAGVVAAFAGCGSVPAGELCRCKDRVYGHICDVCRPLYWNLNPSNPDGCEDCNCHLPGVVGGIATCDSTSGQCTCKASVTSRTCSECADGSYSLREDDLFGCTDCGCDVGGSIDPTCDKNSGQCECKPRVSGLRCTEPLSTHYFPTLHQFQYEAENGRTPDYTSVRYGFDEELFEDYSWKGYAVFSAIQNEIIQDILIRKPSVYRMIMRYVNPNSDPVTGTIKITPDSAGETEQRFQVSFKANRRPTFVTIGDPSGVIPAAMVMNPGRWSISIKMEKSLFLDYFVLLPAAYYEATILTKNVIKPCTIDDRGLCRHYTYPNISTFDTVRGEGGFVSDGDDRVPLKDYYTNRKHLDKLGETQMPLLYANQSVMQFELTIAKPGSYVLLVTYATPVNGTGGGDVLVDAVTTRGRQPAKVVLNTCPYTTLCRQAVIDRNRNIAVFNLDSNHVSVKLRSDNRSEVAVKSIVAIPLEDWSIDYVRPAPVCIRKGGTNDCTISTFPVAPETKRVQLSEQSKTNVTLHSKNFNETIKNLIYLDHNNPMVDVSSKVPNPGLYVFVVHYYQPEHPEFTMDVLVQNGLFYEGKLPIKHCPSVSGCRAIVEQTDGNTKFQLTENFVLSLKEPNHRSVYMEHLLVIPNDVYTDKLLDEQKFDQTKQFLTNCGFDNFHIDPSTEGFCKDAVFSLTADYNNGALPCHCDSDGSLSFECDKFGGQCACKPNVIARQCVACKTGYYGFPDCKPCNCPSTALCETNTGECICPPRVTGKRCDQCEPHTYGFDPIIGCEDCKCSPLGVVRNNMQCDLFNGSCTCKPNIVGRTCDKCAAGFFGFPYCEECECDLRGTVDDVCDQQSAECLCKTNTHGPGCDVCIDGTFDLQESNPDGCSKCFCFGKTTRCTSSSLYRTRLTGMDGWTLASLETDDKEAIINILEEEISQDDRESISVKLESEHPDDLTAYFSAPENYLGNRLFSYGGRLNYTILCSTGLFGESVVAPDLIIHGADTYLFHHQIEQPALNTEWHVSIELVESNFYLMNGHRATREIIMVVLQDLEGIYIRAKYWNPNIVTRLSSVSLDTASEQYTPYADPAHSVEQCTCPQNYDGLSCEQCAKGFYRIPSGPYGGYCVQCQCNGHADECDVETGICINCQHDTTGPHCETCAVGFHGNATHGTPVDCLICACPLPINSNNFATSCDVTPDGERISCDCRPGYWGARCESCAAGYYGRPEVAGDYCKPCECSGNINPDEPDSCDSVTGECLRCLNNTFGAACNLCKPGYYGDAVHLKDCQSCVCSELGTDHCDSHTGICHCLPNVDGEKCDMCIDEHYGFTSGHGCSPCDCDLAAQGTRCDDDSGQCRCSPGVIGRACDRCQSGYWNYTESGCVSCGCHSEYSVGIGCNAKTGHCECLPGVIGDKCDHCPHRWILVPGEGCFTCTNCVHALLDVTDSLSVIIDPVVLDFDTVAAGYFTSQRLAYINESIFQLTPDVKLLDPSRIDLKPIVQELESLEQDARNLKRKTEYLIDTSNSSIPRSNDVRIFSKDVLDSIRNGAEESRNIVSEVDDLVVRFESGVSNFKTDHALQQAYLILDDIDLKNLSRWADNAEEQTEKGIDLIDRIGDFVRPILNEERAITKIRVAIDDFDSKLGSMHVYASEVLDDADDVDELNAANIDSKVVAKVQTAELRTNDAKHNLNVSGELLKNASAASSDARKTLQRLEREQLEQIRLSNELNHTIADIYDELNDARSGLIDAQLHAQNLSITAAELDNLLSDSRYTSEHAVDAANAYKNIVIAIEKAHNASRDSDAAAQNATDMSIGLADRTSGSETASVQMLNDAVEALRTVQTKLQPKLNQSRVAVDEVDRTIAAGEKGNADIIKAVERIPMNDIESVVTKAKDNSQTAGEVAKDTLSAMEEITNNLPDDVKRADQLPKMYEETKNFIAAANDQLLKVQAVIPNISDLIDAVKPKTDELQQDVSDIEEKINRVNQMINEARDVANRIKLGVHFYRNTTLQPKNPPNLASLGTSTKASAYFKTKNPNGFLMYLGNENGTKLKRTQTDDFMALEIENGYPILTIDLGNGPKKLVSDKYVADDVWYQVLVDRTGKNVKLTVREEDEDRKEVLHTKETSLEGPNTIFNLDQEQSKLFVGGYPADANIQLGNRESSFEGEIEDVVIGNNNVSLWNFVDGNHNDDGARERDSLVDTFPVTGYRFSGKGYAIIDGHQFISPTRNIVKMKFKTKDPNGLLFLMLGDGTFFSIELQDGNILYQYKIDRGDTVTTIRTEDADFSDDKWHEIEALRQGAKGQLRIFTNNVMTSNQTSRTDPRQDAVLTVDPYMYFGGYEGEHGLSQVTNRGIDGCIDNVFISGFLIDLSLNVRAFDVLPGCPKKFAGIVSFVDRDGFVKYNVSAGRTFQMTLKFMTGSSGYSENGLLFYATNERQNDTLSLALIGGELILRNQDRHVRTQGINLNDGEWHVVTATHDHDSLALLIDDYYEFSTMQHNVERKLTYEHIYFGGLPRDMLVPETAISTRNTFFGCIEDVTHDEHVMNLANTVAKHGENLGSCASFDGKKYPPIEPHSPYYPVEVDQPGPEDEDDEEEDRPPHRGDGGDSDYVPTKRPGLETTTTEKTTTTTEKIHDVKVPIKLEEPKRECVLPPYPRNVVGYDAGFRLGVATSSRVEYENLPGRHKNKFDFSLEFRTDEPEGIMFYGSDQQHVQFIALFLYDGKVQFRFNVGQGAVSLISTRTFNDGDWHSVTFTRHLNDGKLMVDGKQEAVGSSTSSGKTNNIKEPYYLGGVPQQISNEVTVNLGLNKTLVGCIRNFKHAGHDAGPPKKIIGAIPCSDEIESGVFFSPPTGGYVKVQDRFRVGSEINIIMDIKPRNMSGLILAVHGKRDFLVLQMKDGIVKFTVNNGRGPFEAAFTPASPNYLCDGNWHSIFALKSKNVVTLAVDNVHMDPTTGLGHMTQTQNGLFVGGHPYLTKLKGFSVRQPYSGCIRNLKINGKPIDMNVKPAYGNVTLTVCPTD